MKSDSRIFVAGHRGLAGSAIVRRLHLGGYTNLILRTSAELDLCDQAAVRSFFDAEHPEFVFLAAARVGGILSNNTYRADFIFRNLQIETNVIGESWRTGVNKLLFLGSSCIYPRNCPQPMGEDSLLSSPLEYTNEPYAVAKIAGIKLCEAFNIQYGTNFISVMPTNLYGPNDNFDLDQSHVLPALLRKMHLGRLLEEGRDEEVRADLGASNESEAASVLERHGISARSVEIWGTGAPLREFLHADDMADACVWVMEQIDFTELKKGKQEIRNTHINIGSGFDISIGEVANLVKQIVGFRGQLSFDTSKPDGTMRKLMDTTKLTDLGWRARIDLRTGLADLYEDYCKRGPEERRSRVSGPT